MKSFLLVSIGILFVLPTITFAQEERYELAKRLKAMELIWEDKKPQGESRKRVSESLSRSVSSFFSLRLGEAARSLDEARFSLLSNEPPTDAQRWAAAVSVRPESRLIDLTSKELSVELYAFYPSKVETPTAAKLRLVILNESEKPVGKPVETPIGKLPLSASAPFDGLAEGDYWLSASIMIGTETLSSVHQRISRLSLPADRLKKIGEALAKTDKRTAIGETLRSHRAILQSLLEKQTLETDYPAAQLFAEAEMFAGALNAGNDDAIKKRAGQFWLTLPTGKGRTAVRLFAPKEASKETKVPLVIAMHGAGGSENMFFEGYGAGGIVKLCEKRGWLLVAPRAGLGFGSPTADIIDEVAKLYPVDRKRVFLVGHSMGAATAVATAAAIPEQVSAIAALGGGGRIAKPETVKAVPFFIACGDRDFALPMAKSLAKSLEKVEGVSVTFKEYPDIEHLAIVQVALPDVFAFFDRIGGKK